MKETKEYLQKLGLSEYQAKVMLALYSKGSSAAKEISEETRIPYTKIYEILNRLVDKKFINFKEGKPKYYEAVQPSVVINKLLNEYEITIAELESRKNSALNVLEKDYFLTSKLGAIDDKVRFIPTAELAWKEVESFGNTAQKSLYVISNMSIWSEAYNLIDIVKAWYNAVVNRKVKSKNIIPAELDLNKIVEGSLAIEGADWKRYYGNPLLQDRSITNDRLLHTFIIKDENEIFFALEGQNKVDIAVVYKDKKVAEGLLKYFNKIWEEARSIEEKQIELFEKRNWGNSARC